MKKYLLINIFTLSITAMTGCGGGTEGSNEPGVAAALSATGSTVPAPATIVTGSELEVFDTKSLLVADDFAFDTAQQIDIDFDLESARNTAASVSICTSYQQDSLGYDIDYDSCTVQSDMKSGIFNHSMEVTNEYTSVIAVVWFQDSGIEPIHREFTVRGPTDGRTAKSVDNKRVIVWR